MPRVSCLAEAMADLGFQGTFTRRSVERLKYVYEYVLLLYLSTFAGLHTWTTITSKARRP